MTDTDIDERLRRYGAHLDALAAERTTSGRVSGVERPRHRAGRGLVAAVAAAAVVAGVVAINLDEGRAVRTDTADQPARESARPLPRTAVDGWRVTDFFSDLRMPDDGGGTGFVQSFREPARGFDGPGLVIHTHPTTADWRPHDGVTELTVQGQRAWLKRFSPIGALMTWHPGDGRLVALYADHLSDAQVIGIAEGLRPSDGGWKLSTSDLGLTEVNAGPPAAVRAMALTSYTRDSANVHLRQHATSIVEFETMVQGRVITGSSLRQVTVDGHPAALVRTAEVEGWAALWYDDGVVHELTGDVAEAVFLDVLASVRELDEAEWSSLFPATFVTPGARDRVVKEMLRDVPIPPGFDDTELRRSTEPIGRFGLGVAVTGAVACAWVERNDAAARDAMRDAREWQVLQDMVAEGEWPKVLWESADGWLAGTVDVERVRSTLGCDQR